MAAEERAKKRVRSAAAVVQKSEAVSKKRKVVKEPSPVEPDDSEQSDDDQTEALLEGLESSGDEGSDAEDFKKGQVVPKIPTDPKIQQKLDQAKIHKAGSKTGVIYVG